MKLVDIFKSFFSKLSKRNNKLIDSPESNDENDSNALNQIKNEFDESIKVNIDQSKPLITKDTEKNSSSKIESLKCINDGLGYQKMEKY